MELQGKAGGSGKATGTIQGAQIDQLQTIILTIFSYVILMPVAVMICGKCLAQCVRFDADRNKEVFFHINLVIFRITAYKDEVVLGFTGLILTLSFFGVAMGRVVFWVVTNQLGITTDQFTSICILSSFISVWWSFFLFLYVTFVRKLPLAAAEVSAKRDALIQDLAAKVETGELAADATGAQGLQDEGLEIPKTEGVNATTGARQEAEILQGLIQPAPGGGQGGSRAGAGAPLMTVDAVGGADLETTDGATGGGAVTAPVPPDSVESPPAKAVRRQASKRAPRKKTPAKPKKDAESKDSSPSILQATDGLSNEGPGRGRGAKPKSRAKGVDKPAPSGEGQEHATEG